MKIFVTRKIPGNIELLKSNNEVSISEFDRPLTPEELIEKGIRVKYFGERMLK